MGLKDAINKIVDNVKDTANEASHKSAAEGEQAKRDVAGDQMSVGENLGSMANQAKEELQGETAATKRDVRNST